MQFKHRASGRVHGGRVCAAIPRIRSTKNAEVNLVFRDDFHLELLTSYLSIHDGPHTHATLLAELHGIPKGDR